MSGAVYTGNYERNLCWCCIPIASFMFIGGVGRYEAGIASLFQLNSPFVPKIQLGNIICSFTKYYELVVKLWVFIG